jgi:hypothetical protein
MKSHFILTWDRAKKTYRYFAVNNMPDAEMATESTSTKMSK